MLNNLENNVIPKFPNFEETYLVINNENERKLHRMAGELLEKNKKKLALTIKDLENGSLVGEEVFEFDPDEKLIISHSDNLICQRIFALFDKAFGLPLHLNDSYFKWLFIERLKWFLKDITDWIIFLRRKDQIMQSPDYFNLCYGEQDQRLSAVETTWRDWFSKESWRKYYEEHKIVMRNFEDLSPQEKLQLEKVNREDDAFEKKMAEQEQIHLRDKCPNCTAKCTWYYAENKKIKST